MSSPTIGISVFCGKLLASIFSLVCLSTLFWPKQTAIFFNVQHYREGALLDLGGASNTGWYCIGLVCGLVLQGVEPTIYLPELLSEVSIKTQFHTEIHVADPW